MRINTLFKANLALKLFGFAKIPIIGFLGPKLVRLDYKKCILRIKLKRRTKNHLNSMYLGVLAVGADLACGMLALYHIQESGENISLFDFSTLYGKQFVFVLASLLVIIITLTIEVKFYERFSSIFYLVCIFLVSPLDFWSPQDFCDLALHLKILLGQAYFF